MSNIDSFTLSTGRSVSYTHLNLENLETVRDIWMDALERAGDRYKACLLYTSSFEFKDSGQRAIGFIAQDIDELQDRLGTSLPLVDHSGDYAAIPYPNLTALLTGAVKAQQREIEALEQRIGGTTA